MILHVRLRPTQYTPAPMTVLAAFTLFALLANGNTAVAQSGSKRMPSRAASQNRSTTVTAAPKGIAVVELFTSQGCSSCPPADAVLQQVKSVAEKGNYPVYVLSFHVDYWNRLGWTDPYSSEAYSKRQRSYASASGSKRVYTPQMIVNGTQEFVGSKKDLANTAILASLKQPSTVKVSLKRTKASTGSALVIGYQTKGARPGQIINVAIVETPQANKVPRGENGGRTLAHVNVVRAFKTIPLGQASGQVELELPANVDAKNASVIAYVQNTRDRKVVGAEALAL